METLNIEINSTDLSIILGALSNKYLAEARSFRENQNYKLKRTSYNKMSDILKLIEHLEKNSKDKQFTLILKDDFAKYSIEK